MKSRNRKSKGTHPSVPQPRTPQPQYSAAEVLICSRPEGLDSNEALLRNIGALPVSLASALARFAQEMGYGNPIALMVRIELPIVEGITPQPIKRAAARPESHPSQPTLLEDDGDDQDEDDDDPDEDNQDDNDEREKSLSEHEQRRVLEIAGYMANHSGSAALPRGNRGEYIGIALTTYRVWKRATGGAGYAPDRAVQAFLNRFAVARDDEGQLTALLAQNV